MQVVNLAGKMVYSDSHLTKKIIYRDKDVLAFMLNFQPGQTLPNHNHPGMVTIVQVVKGSARVTIDNKDSKVNPGQLIVLQENEFISLVNDGADNLSLYVTLSPGPTDDKFAEEF